MEKPSISFLCVVLLIFVVGAVASQMLPDEASMDAPSDPTMVMVLPQYPKPGKKYLVERDGQQEIWVVKDSGGTIEFVDISSQQVKLSIKLGPCFSFSSLPGHDFGRWGKPAFDTVPEDCKAWDGRTWTQTYGVQIPRLSQPCYYLAKRRAKVEGKAGDRLLTSDFLVEIHTARDSKFGGSVLQRKRRITYSESLDFFKELTPGYIGRAVILRELN